MAQERFIPFLPQTRNVDLQKLIHDVEAPPIQLPAPTEEEARALDQVFAAQPEDRSVVLDGITIAAAGMVVHDLIKDTLQSPENEDDHPAIKRRQPDDGPRPV
jgi:hypothetical protein